MHRPSWSSARAHSQTISAHMSTLQYNQRRNGLIREPFTSRQRRARVSPPAAAAAEAAAAAGPSAAFATPAVVLTREAGKNSKLCKVLTDNGVACLEMPLVETAVGPDRAALNMALNNKPMTTYDWIALTSPEAAKVGLGGCGYAWRGDCVMWRVGFPTACPSCHVITLLFAPWQVFIEAWRAAGRPAVRIAVVGEGTGKVLTEAEGNALQPAFTPSVVSPGCHLPWASFSSHALTLAPAWRCRFWSCKPDRMIGAPFLLPMARQMLSTLGLSCQCCQVVQAQCFTPHQARPPPSCR